MTTLTFDAALSIVESLEPFPIDFDIAVEWLGYSTKQKAEESLKANFQEGFDFLTSGLKNTGERGRPSKQIHLSIDCLKSMGMMAGTERGKEIRRYFLECERITKARIATNKETLRLKELELRLKIAECELERVRIAAASSAPAQAVRRGKFSSSRKKAEYGARQEVRNQILDLLTKNPDGLTVFDIAVQLQLSEPHIRKTMWTLYCAEEVDRTRMSHVKQYLYCLKQEKIATPG